MSRFTINVRCTQCGAVGRPAGTREAQVWIAVHRCRKAVS